MRIAVYHNQPSGGARRALYEISKRLASRHELDVFTLQTSDEQFLSSGDFARNVYVHPFSPRTPVRFGLYLNEVRQLLDLRDLDRIGKEVAERIDGAGYDVALVDACRFTQSPAVLANLRLPSAYYCHEPPRRFIDAAARPAAAPLTVYERARLAWHAPGRIVYDRAVQRADRRNVACATTVLTNSEHTRRLIRAYYGRDAAMVPLGVDTDRFTPGGARSDYVLSVGALEPHKGFDFLVLGIGRIPVATRPRLVIAGNTDSAGVGADLKRLAAGAGVDLTIALRISEEELVSLYRGARVFAYAPHHEPFGLVVLEAMACGLPVVAVAEGGPLESVVDGVTGALTPRDENAFAKAIASMIDEPRRAAAMGVEGRRVAEERWSWDAAASRVEQHLVALAPQRAEVAA